MQIYPKTIIFILLVLLSRNVIRLLLAPYLNSRMEKLCVVNAMIKGHHVYQTNFEVGTSFICEIEPNNQHSDTAIVVLKDLTVIGHVPEGLCQPFHHMLANNTVDSIRCILTGQAVKSSLGTWTCGGGIELPCTYMLFGRKEMKKEVRACVRQALAKLK